MDVNDICKIFENAIKDGRKVKYEINYSGRGDAFVVKIKDLEIKCVDDVGFFGGGD